MASAPYRTSWGNSAGSADGEVLSKQSSISPIKQHTDEDHRIAAAGTD